MHADLARSLDHIIAACRAAPQAAAIADALAIPAARLHQGQRLPPEGFATYFEAAECLFADDLDGALAAAARLQAMPARAPGLAIVDRGRAGEVDRMLDRRMGAGAARFHPIPEALGQDFLPRLNAGFALLDAGAPALAAEIRAILSVILLAQAPPGAKREFDGASHYQFWGLLLLNPHHHKTPLAVAEVLAHEAGHSLLFGLTRDEALVLNPDDELYPSPLRVDPRPMDGIYHATFVSARMAYAMEALADSGVLTAQETAQARAEARKDRDNFARGLSVVRAHGRLSATGAAIMADAERAVANGWT
jgi:HEXXH motif-containing protein